MPMIRVGNGPWRTVLALAAMLGARPAAAVWTTIDAGRGDVAINVPAGVEPGNPAPLAVMLHGYGGTGVIYEDYLGLAAKLEAAGFIYAIPDGTTDTGGSRFWNATDGCCNKYDSTIDDVAYLENLIDAIDTAHGVTEVHVFGVSNGGFMSYRLACDTTIALESIASISGATWKDETLCAPAQALRVLEVHGTLDSQILYNGGFWEPGEEFGLAAYPSVPETMGDWRTYNGCTATMTQGSPFDADSSLAGAETEVEKWITGCDLGGATELWRIVGSEHLPAFTDTFRDRLVSWFRAVSSEVFFDGFEGGSTAAWSDVVP
jgi:polyhydroxybutyrate depolymerase